MSAKLYTLGQPSVSFMVFCVRWVSLASRRGPVSFATVRPTLAGVRELRRFATEDVVPAQLAPTVTSDQVALLLHDCGVVERLLIEKYEENA